MHLVAIGWIYVVLMMSIAEESAVAGFMTFVFYGLLPVALLLYLSASSQRKRLRAASKARTNAGAAQREQAGSEEQS